MSLDFSNLHILVVEDMPPMRELLEQLLKALGVGKITIAKDGFDGHEKYLRYKPDIIITDWQMPGLDGLEMTKQIRCRKSSPNRSVPIIMMTGFIDKKRISNARDSGVTEFLIKPFSAKDMAKRVSYVTQNPRDFVVTSNYIGPDRRRKNTSNINSGNRRKANTPNIIKDKRQLEQKVGTGEVSILAIERSQKVIDENNIDFEPIARIHLDKLATSIRNMKNTDNFSAISCESLVYPIMQIKANARIFKYDLIGDLAGIMLNFMGNVNAIDEYILQIVEAHQNTVNHILNKKQKGKQGKTGQTLQEELDNACHRYLKVKNKISQGKLKKVAGTK